MANEAIITFSTVGFGDFSPSTVLGRCFASLWMILGVLAFGNLASWRVAHTHNTHTGSTVHTA